MAGTESWQPLSVEDFLADPTRSQWKSHLRDGACRWAGPDGASWCPDRLVGVRIGVVSPAWEHRDLPANMHDWHYRLGRRFNLPKAWRQRADAQLKYNIRATLVDSGIGGGMYAVGWFGAAVIYWVVRLLGGRSWRG